MALCSFATQRPISSHGGKLQTNAGLILHVQAGENSPYRWFCNRDNKASSHFWISKTGVLEQYIDTDFASWAQAAGNYRWVSVETEGLPGEPLTGAQIYTLAMLYRWGHQVHEWPFQLSEVPSGSGFGWHGMGGESWGHVACPGAERRAQRRDALNMAIDLTFDQPPPISLQKDDEMSERLTITWPDGTKTVGKPDGAIHAWGTEANPVPSFGSFFSLQPNERQALNWPLKEDFDALIPVDLQDKSKGYIACCIGKDNQAYQFKFNADFLKAHS